MTTPASPVAEGLRERKKRERRELIAATAMRLFAEHGYGATTIARIAEEADVSPRTVSLYFPAKEDLVFVGADETQDRLRLALAERAEGETFDVAMRRWLDAEIIGWRASEAEMAARRDIIEREPALKAVELRNRARLHDLLVGAIAEDVGDGTDGLEAQLVAAATIAVFDVLGDRLHERKASGANVLAGDEVLELFDRALVFVRGGMKALGS